MIQNNLKLKRQEKGFTQAQLAKIVGITEVHYQRVEYGKAEPKVTLAGRLALALNVAIPDIFPLPREEAGK